ncbi:MAG: hypothetical protein V4534_08485 [Myxococcota bacterium]
MKNIFLSLSLLSSFSFATSQTLAPGEVALVQTKNGNWIEIKTTGPASKSFWSKISNHAMAIGSVGALISYVAYKSYAGQDTEMAELEKRFEALKLWQLERSLN